MASLHAGGKGCGRDRWLAHGRDRRRDRQGLVARAGSHRTGAQLVTHTPTKIHVHRSVHDGQDRFDGYVATQDQPDGSTYIDFIAVTEEARRSGVATALINAVTSSSHTTAAHFHLTVRADNEAARRLYGRLGFEETRMVVPYRRGFTLDSQDAAADS